MSKPKKRTRPSLVCFQGKKGEWEEKKGNKSRRRRKRNQAYGSLPSVCSIREADLKRGAKKGFSIRKLLLNDKTQKVWRKWSLKRRSTHGPFSWDFLGNGKFRLWDGNGDKTSFLNTKGSWVSGGYVIANPPNVESRVSLASASVCASFYLSSV